MTLFQQEGKFASCNLKNPLNSTYMKTETKELYIAPSCESMDLALESAVLQTSIPDFLDGGELS